MAGEKRPGAHGATGAFEAVQTSERTDPSITDAGDWRDSVVIDPRRIVMPMAGLVRWKHRPGKEPKALGVWGRDFPCVPHLLLDNGDVRPLTRAERRWMKRMARACLGEGHG